MTKVLDLYQCASRIPLVGRRAFSWGFALKAPYFLTIAPLIAELRPHYAAVRIRNWWGCTTTSAPCMRSRWPTG